MRCIAIGLGVLGVSTLAACAVDTSRPTQAWNPSGADDAGSEPRSDAEVKGDPPESPDAATLGVLIEASAQSVCPGECATLNVRVDGAAPSESVHTFSWTDAADAASEPQAVTREVCPTSSTTYHVDVRERADSTGEFGREGRSGGADLTLSVRRDCDDAGTPPPEDEGCSYRIPIALPNQGIVSFSGHVKQDAHGNLYLAAGFTGKVSIAGKVFGKDSLLASGNTDVLLAKFDSTCKLLWAKQFEGDGQFTTLYNFDVGPDGSMALLTWDMNYDFFFFNQETHQHLYVLDAQGNRKWDRVGGGYAPHAPQAFDFGPDGALAVSSVAACGSEADLYCVGVFNADGSVRYAIDIDMGFSVGVAFDAAGNLVLAGLGRENVDDYFAYAMLFDANGERWTRRVPALQDQITSIEARAIFADNGDVLSPRVYVDPQGQHLHVWRTDAQGTTVEDQDYVQPEAAGWVQYLWPMLDGTYAVMATRPLVNAPADGQFEEQVLLQRRKADGSVLFERDVSVGKYSAPGPVVPGPDGALGFTVIEMREHNEVIASRGRTTALVLKRVGG